MRDINGLSDALEKYPGLIYQAQNEVALAREKMDTLKHAYDLAFAGRYLKARAEKTTADSAKMAATLAEEVQAAAASMIQTECAWRKAVAELNRLENEFTSVRKEAELLKIAP